MNFATEVDWIFQWAVVARNAEKNAVLTRSIALASMMFGGIFVVLRALRSRQNMPQ
jgi:hypothetical protein